MWNSHSSKILQVKLGQKQTMGSAIRGAPAGRRVVGTDEWCHACGEGLETCPWDPDEGWGMLFLALLSEQIHRFVELSNH